MKTERFAPWMFVSAAIVIFVMVILASVWMTMILAPSADFSAINQVFHPQDTQSTFMPILNRVSSPQDIISNSTTQDSSPDPQAWDENANP